MSEPTSKTTMGLDLCDVSPASHGERLRHFLTDFAGQDQVKRMECHDIAWQAATEEMLDEIHTMLRHLTGV